MPNLSFAKREISVDLKVAVPMATRLDLEALRLWYSKQAERDIPMTEFLREWLVGSLADAADLVSRAAPSFPSAARKAMEAKLTAAEKAATDKRSKSEEE